MSTGKKSRTASGQDLDLTGRTIADFRIERRLGQGGMGQVYLAEQISLKRPVALKILRPELAASPEAHQRFQVEAQAVARATHANILQVYGVGMVDGMAYMALEYVEGRNLKEYLARKGPPDLAVAISIMRQVASALQRAGELGIIHRDIKPENILLTRKGEVKVADFGLVPSRCLGGEAADLHLTQTGVTMGTPMYMSPEQVEGKPLDPRTDVYSFGVTCYHLLAGQPPFHGESAFEVALQHVKAQPPPLSKIRPDLPEALCAMVHKMLAKDPADRFQTAKDLLREIVRLRDGLGGVNVTGAVQPIQESTGPFEAVAAAPTPTDGRATLTTFVPRRSEVGVLLMTAILLSTLLAAGVGAIVALKKRGPNGPLPAGQVIPVADASVPEALNLPSKRERALRNAVEKYLNPAAPAQVDRSAGFADCARLGLLYLDSDRLDRASDLFHRLELISQPPSYRALGRLGQGIVLALRNDPKGSNSAFRKIRHNGGKSKSKQLPGPLVNLLKEEGSRWRYWLARARWYNSENGPSQQEPPFFKRFPLRESTTASPGRFGPPKSK